MDRKLRVMSQFKGMFILVENIFHKNTYDYNYKVIREHEIFYVFNIIYKECCGK